MLYWLFEITASMREEGLFFKLFRVLQYPSVRAALACLIAFLFIVLTGEWLIRKLISLKMGQPIRTAEEVNKLFELHGRKKGTPTMGGIMIVAGVTLATLLGARLDNYFVWTVLFVFLSLAGLGFIDDYQKVVKKNSKGVSAKAKLIVQLTVALTAGGFLAYCHWGDDYMRALYLPFIKEPFIKDMAVFSLAMFAAVIVGSSNAVNLTDGLDGLATGCTISVSLAYAIICYVVGSHGAAEYLRLPHHANVVELTVICMALVGAGLGFLWFNCAPAKVFMGDTSSLAIGGLLGTVAICCKHEVTLLIVGFVFVMEALSVMLQVTSYRLRGGKRIFRMSPIHHHFELGGMAETTVVVRFWIVSLLCALLGLATLKLR
jgi:phospho-N-acetylmuramoyl-pentapeptide-transferase